MKANLSCLKLSQIYSKSFPAYRSQWNLMLMALMLIGALSGCCNCDDPGICLNERCRDKCDAGCAVVPDQLEVEAYEGELGLNINTREIARKGYEVSRVTFSIDGATFDTTGTLQMDRLTQLAILKKKVRTMSEAQYNELKETGVRVKLTALDANQNVVGTYEEAQVYWAAGPASINMQTNLPNQYLNSVEIREGVSHYVQAIDRQTRNVRYAIGGESATDSRNTTSLLFRLTNLTGSTANTFSRYRFEKVPNEPGVYNISMIRQGRTLYWYVEDGGKRIAIQNYKNWQLNGNKKTNAVSIPRYKFKIEQVEPGLFVIRSVSTGMLATIASGSRLEVDVASNPENSSVAFFRIIALDIDWFVETVDYRQLQPVLPKANTTTAYSSELINCSSGDLVQEVGREETKTSSLTVSWDESFSLSTSVETSVTMKTEAEVSAEYFGSGASVSQSMENTLTVGVEATASRTQGADTTTTTTVQTSFLRTITVPPGSGTQIYDLYQTYSNVKMPFVRKFRVTGNYQTGNSPLSGEEILTQLNFNQFEGVISEVGTDYVEMTIRGSNVIDEMIETRIIAREVNPDCD